MTSMTPGEPAEPKIPKYMYELQDDPGDPCRKFVMETRDKYTKVPIAAIRQFQSSSKLAGTKAGRWRIGPSHQLMHGRGMGIVEQGWNMGSFDTPESAFDVIVQVRKLHLTETALVPLPEDLREWVNRQARNVGDRIKRAETELFDANVQARELNRLAEQYNLEMAALFTDHSDADAAVRNLINFKIEGDEAPFFSETVLYELIGKDAARSLLGTLRRMVSVVSPSQSFGL